MKRKLKTNCSIVRIVRLFDCGRLVRCAIAVALCAVGFAAFAAPVEYPDWDDVNKKMTNAVCSVYEEYTDQTTLEAGKTYVVNSAVTNMTSDVVVWGTAANPTRLIICDGAELFLQGQSAAETAGLGVASGNALVIYGQAAGTGKLTAIGGGGAAGIGGGSSSAGGTVTINGGIITATGGTYGAGIGGGMAKNGGTVTINGGVVTATGSNGGAGIGVGYQGGDAGTVAFGEGLDFSVKAGANAASAVPVTQESYTNDHSAAYVFVEYLVPGSEVISAVSDEFTVDLRTSVALAEGEVEVDGITWSATAWGDAPETETTDLGWTNLTTGATGLLATGLHGPGQADFDLPAKDGEYRLTHSAGGLESFVTFVVSGYPLGIEGNPWKIGTPDPESVIAWKDGDGVVYFRPARSAVTREGLETITNSLGGADFAAKLVGEDGSVTNDVVMIVGASGAAYDTLGEALAAGEESCTLYDVEGCIVNYDGNGAFGEMATDTFLPGAPTNLTANAFTAVGWSFEGWTTNGGDTVVFADRAAIADPQPGDVYDLKAVWRSAPVTVRTYDELTNALAAAAQQDAGLPATLKVAGTITVPDGEKVVIPGDPAKADVVLTGSGWINGVVENGGNLVVGGTVKIDYVYLLQDATIAVDPADPLELGAWINVVTEVPVGVGEPVAIAVAQDGDEEYFTSEDGVMAYEDGAIVLHAEGDRANPWKIGRTDRDGVIAYREADGTLVIEGSGEMQDFFDDAPWNDVSGKIDGVIVGADVRNVGDTAFEFCPTNDGATVLFRNPAQEIGLGAFVSLDECVTNIPVVKVEVVTDDGRTLRVVPGGWTDAEDPDAFYESLAEAFELGAVAVTAAFEKNTDVGPVELFPKEVEEIVVVTDGTGAEAELSAKFVNDPNGLDADETVGLAADVENIASSVEALNSNVVVTVKLESAGTMDEALSNACETAKADFAPDAATLGFVAHNFDLDVAWSLAGEGGELTELPESVVVHIPMKLYDGLVYSVSRLHGGAFETLPERTAETVDSATAEWFRADVANGEIVIKTRLFCPYAIGVLELEKTCTVIVGNGDKYVGERDPVALTTNFTLTVTGPLNLSEFAGYAKRVPGESAGGYAINFVCVKMPEGFPEAGFEVQPGVFTIADRPDRLAPTGKVTYAKAKKGNILVKGKPATWKAKPALGCVFAGWSWIGEGAEPAGFKKLSANERRKPTLKFTVGKKETIHPQDFAATWARIDDDTIGSVAFVTNATGKVTALAVDTFSYVTATVKGLPKGLKFTAKKLKVSGSPTKNGTFTASVSVKNASGYKWSGKFRFRVSGKKVVSIELVKEAFTGVPLMLWCDTKMGSVTGCGVFKAKSTRTVNAKPKSGYVFAGWFTDPGFSTPAEFKGGKDYRTAKQKLVVKGPTYLFARFLPKTTAADPIVWLRYAGAGYCGAPAGFLDEEETWYQGVKLPTNACQIAFYSASLPTVTVKGLPKGVTFDKRTLRFKGVPTKAGKYTVKVTVKNKSAATDALTRRIVVKALPKWLVGTYDGVSYGPDDEGGLVENGSATVTVGSTGKLSGKTVVKGKASSFKASSFADVVLDGEALVYVSGTKTFAESAETGLGEFVWTTNGVERAWAVQRGWSRKDLALPLPVFPTGTKALKLTETADDGSVIKLTFGAKGAVTVAGKVPGKGGKLAAISGSSRVLPIAVDTVQDAPDAPERLSGLLAETCVNIAPTKKLPAGFCAAEPLLFSVGSNGKANGVSAAEPALVAGEFAVPHVAPVVR